MTIGVATPTGHVGQHVLRLLVQAGERPRALLRDPSKLDPELRELVDTAVLDVLDPGTIYEATEGLSALYWVSPTVTDDPVRAHRDTAGHLRTAVQRNGIGRIVFQSSGGAEMRSGLGEIDGLAATEVALDATGANVTHLRCGYFFSNLLMDAESVRAGTLTTAMELDHAMPWVAPQDIAAVGAARLLSRTWSGRHVQGVFGPEDLSFRQVAEILSEVLDRPVQAQQVSDDDVRAQLTEIGLAPAQIDALVDMTAGIRDGYEPDLARSVLTTTPTTLRSWAAQNLRS